MAIIATGSVILALLIAANASSISSNLGRNLFKQQLGISEGYTSKNVRETTFTQWVDHNNAAAGFFNQAIFINDQFYRLGGPVFIYITSYGGAEDYWLEESYIARIAEEQGGIVYGIQPRFFGTSRPTPDLSLESLRLLTINQTISDITEVTSFLRNEFVALGSDKFIAFGYGTGANLAIFTHQRNPGLFDGVWAAGAADVWMNFDEYFYDILNLAASELDAPCSAVLHNWYDELEQLVAVGEAARITELFGLTNEINLSDENEVGLLFYLASITVADHFEWGTPAIRANFCQNILQSVNNGATDLEALTAYLNTLISGISVDWNAAVEEFRRTEWDTEISQFGQRQTFYLVCTEWSWFQTSYGIFNAAQFRFTENLFIDFCSGVFEVTANDIIGGNRQTQSDMTLSPTLQNVFFTYGGTDPFRLLGQRSDLNLWSPMNVVPRFGKGFELLGDIPADDVTPELLAVQSNVRSRILAWIGV